jgi:quinol monooxygenase YgiN
LPSEREEVVAEVVVVGAFTAKPGKEDEARAAFEDLLEPTHAESGCILYALHQGADDPTRLAFIERWASPEELDAHLKTDHVAAVLARADDLFDASDITVYGPVPGGESRKGSLAEHAGSAG